MTWNPGAIKQLREKRGLSQQALADLVGAHRVTIARIELGMIRPHVDLAEAIAKALHVSIAKLFD